MFLFFIFGTTYIYFLMVVTYSFKEHNFKPSLFELLLNLELLKS
jgi:hypothetical protein